MDKSRYFLPPDIWLDYRGVVWLPELSILAAADLHLGYAWAHRYAGQMMPLSVEEDAVARLETLVREYKPKTLVLLGDLVHRAVPAPEIELALRRLCEALCGATELVLLLGNHDRGIGKLSGSLSPSLQPRPEYTAGGKLFVHGDQLVQAADRLIIMGHEHPAISLGDGVATSRKFPCFLKAERLLVLPAFSQWAAGTSLSEGFMSPLAKRACFTQAIAILGKKLLPVSL